MIQMKGATIDTSNTATFGTVLNYNGAGNYEYNTIQSVTGTTIQLTYQLQHAYNIPDGKVQFVKVPSFQNYTVSQPHTCAPWDGNKGGILAITVFNTLTLNNVIDVSGMGFLGAQPYYGNFFPGCGGIGYYYPATNNEGALKGEGIAVVGVDKMYGRGALANGGGGGNNHNSGGGGGSNAANGGQGGDDYLLGGCTYVPGTGGVGGISLTYNNTANKAFLGGGGGAGHANDAGTQRGGNGGGLILINTGTLAGNAQFINANGENAPQCSGIGAGCQNDGTSGGGGGGTVLTSVTTYTGTVNMSATGGKGADSYLYPIPPTTEVGPGAGGGGGAVWFNQTSAPVAATTTLTGGAHGILPQFNDTAWGSTNGNAGQTLTGLQLAFPTIIAPPCIIPCNTLALADTASVCANDTVTLAATIAGSDSILSTHWTPATGLSDTTSLTPLLTSGTTSGYYHITVQSVHPDNLVVNGDFSGGNTGFTSAYTYATGSSGLVPTSVYAITTSPSNNHPQGASFGDHTTGTGNMMAINGASSPVNVWCQTITVTPNTDYAFSSWFANWSANTTSNLPQLQFEINGNPLGTVFNIPGTPGLWTQFYATWNSGSATTATICIHDQQTAASGNDFSIDDISFQQFCTATDSIYVKVRNTGTFIAGSNSPVCAGDSLKLTAPTATGYQWTGPNSFTATTQNPVITNVTAAATGNYVVKGTVNNCPVKDTVAVVVNASPVANAGPDIIACQSTQVQLNGTGGGSYSWTPANVLTNAATATPTLTLTDTTIKLILTITNASGCTAKDTVQVSIHPKPTANAGIDTGFCAGGSVQLNGTGGGSYLWYPAAGFSSTTIANPTFSGVSGTYNLAVTSPNGCADTDNVVITVHTLPIANAGPDITACQSTQVQLSGSGGTAYAWTPTSVLSNANTATPTLLPTDTTIKLVLTVTDANGCKQKDSVLVSVHPKPVANAGIDTGFCAGGSVQLQGTGGGSYLWYPNTGFSNNTIANPTFNGASGTYSLAVTSPAGCSDTDNIQIAAHPLPIANAGPDTAVCPNVPFLLHGSGGATYSWSPAAYILNPNSATPSVTISTNQTFQLTATSSFGCTATDDVNVSVLSLASFSVTPEVDICIGKTGQLHAAGGTNYAWSPATGLSNPNSSDPTVTISQSTTYQVTISAPTCDLSLTYPVQVNVIPFPPVRATASNNIDCSHNLTTLTATGAATYVWTPAYALNDPYSTTPTANPEMTTTYTVVGTDAYGCVAQSDVTVNVVHDGDGHIVEPNAFTPNGDGLNDCFRIELPGSNVSGFELHIFDRWGTEVWHTYSLNDCWDGTFNGVLQPLGVYVYYYKAKSSFCGPIQGKGNVTLVR